jgi:hypothetical protein
MLRHKKRNTGTETRTSFTMSNHQEEPTVVIVTSCMNRAQHLSQSIDSWVQLPKKLVKLIYVLDWSSSPALQFDLFSKQTREDSRIVIERVSEVNQWLLSVSVNFAWQRALFLLQKRQPRTSGKIWILKVDCDTIFTQPETFFQDHPLSDTEQIFYSGSWKVAQNENAKHLNGVVLAKSKDWQKVGGYNEYIRSYGW